MITSSPSNHRAFLTALGAVLVAGLILVNSLHADWPQFRGHNSDGIGSGSPPTQFGPGNNELWHTTLAPGHSSPCISGKRIFVTTYDKDESAVAVVCLNRMTGEVLKKRSRLRSWKMVTRHSILPAVPPAVMTKAWLPTLVPTA